LYINDIVDEIPYNVKCVLFADDIKVFREVKTVEDSDSLQFALNKITEWSKRWQIDISVPKCVALHLGQKNAQYSYSIHGYLIETSSTC
jgi:Reverse transcriptase (RNA-dependent DNA polymerase)